MNEIQGKLEAKLNAKKVQRDALDAEISELEIALKVLRRELTDEDGSSEPSNGVIKQPQPNEEIVEERPDLSSMTILEASCQILRENRGLPLHYARIAEIALERGYSSGRETDAQSMTRSFSQILRRSAQGGGPVSAIGGGMFGLNPSTGNEGTSRGQQE